MEIDHVFVLTSARSPAARALLTVGLAEGSRNRHPGQGTANRRFFFRNAMLELLWVEDEGAAGSPAVRRTGLLARWQGRDTGACPFGICLRPSEAGEEPSFATWEYRPPWLPTGPAIPVGADSENPSVPFVFWLPFGHRPDHPSRAGREPLSHGPGMLELSRVDLAGPCAQEPSDVLRAVVDAGLVTLHTGAQHLLELGFDDEFRGGVADLRPSLPLRLRW